MNKETVEGKFDQATGTIKQKVGEAIGNQKLANSGVADEIKGAAKETWGKTKDAAEAAAKRSNDANIQTNANEESLTQRLEDAGNTMREKLVNATQNAKNTISEKLDEMTDRQDKA